MAKSSMETASRHVERRGFEADEEDLGGFTVAWERHTEDMDRASLFVGLPDDRCQCPHWGIVLKGKLIYRYADGDDVITAGEAYYAGPGHTPVFSAGTEVIEFSPTDELAETIEVVTRNTRA
jgi:hypothetical protein